MPTVENYPNTTGYEADHHDCEIFIDGKPYSVMSIDSEHGMARAMQTGSGQLPQSKTRGKYEPGDLSVTMTRTTYEALLDAMGDDWMNKIFEMRRTITIPGRTPSTDIWRGVTVDNDSGSSEEGGDALEVEWTCSFLQHIPHGKRPIGTMAPV